MSKKQTPEQTEQTKKPIPPSPEPSHGVAPMWSDWPEGLEPADENTDADTDADEEDTDADADENTNETDNT